jgi:serine/threonine protein kinase/Tol biopolymer transport system component
VDLVAQLNSALAGRYLIERQIGQGGMATVYLARDVRHDRPVALKVLNPELGAVVGMERFLAEIRVTANLQHPHLLPLFDSGQAEGQLFYVMPYVDGESLRDRIRREKQLPIDEALRITAGVASALDYAHRHGIIHRDLKPENILLQEGQPLVADFGIALAVSVAGGTRITQTGLSLGTPHYMSPEQATGDRVIDRRTDVYSLGAVLYEMLTGDPPHTGSTAQAIIAKVLTDKPRSIRLSRDTVPVHVEAAVQCALAKLPADRFATTQDFVDSLRGARPVTVPSGWATPASVSSDPTIRAARRRARIRQWLPWSIAAAGALAALVAPFVRGKPEVNVARFLLSFSDTARLRSPTGVTIALSRDGKRMVYAGGPEGSGQLFIRDLNDLVSKPIRGTDRGQNPSFSPDGRSLLFTLDGRVMRIGAEGGTPLMVSDTGNSATWAEGGIILFIRNSTLHRTTPNGGVSQNVVATDTTRYRTVTWPRVLPGGKAALITMVLNGVAGFRLGVVKFGEDTVRDLGIDGTNAHYLPTGHLVFGRAAGGVFGVPFDLRRLRALGPPVQLIQDVIVKPGGATEFGVADDGTMIYRSGSAASRSLVYVDNRGARHPAIRTANPYVWPRISPDGKRIAVTLGSSLLNSAQNVVWVYDTESGALTRLSPAGYERPEWASDGKHLLMINNSERRVAIQPWDGSGQAATYTTHSGQLLEISVPRRGRGYLAVRIGGGQQRNIWIAPIDSPTALRPFLTTNADEYQPAVSPDGTMLAYVSDESGRLEVYVRPMPGPGARVQISTDGGAEPVWSPVGSRIFYRGSGSIMAAELTLRDRAVTVTRAKLFDDTFVGGGPSRANYAVTPDGLTFLFLTEGVSESRAVVMLNWFEEVRQRMAAAP